MSAPTAHEQALALGWDIFLPYTGPFKVQTFSNDDVRIVDADGYVIIDLNTHTQLPLADTDLLRLETQFCVETANMIVAGLNARHRIDELIELIRVANTRHGKLNQNGHERIGLLEHVKALITST